MFPDCWIEKVGRIPWDLRSPDMDFSLWGYTKYAVYRTKLKDLDDLKQRISADIATIEENTSRRLWTEIEYRLVVLCATNGFLIEIYITICR